MKYSERKVSQRILELGRVISKYCFHIKPSANYFEKNIQFRKNLTSLIFAFEKIDR